MTGSGLSTCHACGQEVELVRSARGHTNYRAYDPGFGELHCYTCPKFLRGPNLTERQWKELYEGTWPAQEGAQQPQPREGLFASKLPPDEPPAPAMAAKRQPARRFVGIDVPK